MLLLGLKVSMPDLEAEFFYLEQPHILLSSQGKCRSILQGRLLQVGTWIQIKKTALFPLQGAYSLQFVQLWKQCLI